jgi:hypothetical protein
MRPRTYALSFIISAAGLFLGVIAANLVIDPENVLGTGLLGPPLNPNSRFQRFVAYQAAPEKYDALFFGSSRALYISRDELTRRMNGMVFANFAVTYGLITDHVPVLEYVLREQARQGRRLHAVFLLLDVDSFGEQPRTNRFIQTILPPAVSGEPTARTGLEGTNRRGCGPSHSAAFRRGGCGSRARRTNRSSRGGEAGCRCRGERRRASRAVEQCASGPSHRPS